LESPKDIMNQLRDRRCPASNAETLLEWPNAEVFFLTACRCQLAGYATGDVACWEVGWQGASRLLPLADAKRIMAEVACFARILHRTHARALAVLPYCCGRVTPDECLLVRLIGAAQRGQLVAAGCLAEELTNNEDHVALVDAASDLGCALRESGLVFADGAGTEPAVVNPRGMH
jgi:hypothetical protein